MLMCLTTSVWDTSSIECNKKKLFWFCASKKVYFTRYFVLQLVQAFKIRQLNVWCVVCLIYCMVLFCFILFPCLFLIYLLFWFHLYNEKDKNVSDIKSLQTLIHKTSMIIFSNCMHTEFTHSFTVFSVGNEAKYWNQLFFFPL